MATIIQFTPTPRSDMPIDIRKLTVSNLISPAVEAVSTTAITEHASEPIKDMNDIDRVCRYYKDNGRYRDYMLFIVGINFGLRVSDLLSLRFSHLIDDNFTFRTTFPILEKKTSNTRKVKKNRYITINEAVIEAVTLYLRNTPNVKLSDFMFRSESNNSKNQNKPMTRQAADAVLKKAGSDLGLDIHIATHTLRKTFAYHQMLISKNDPRKLLLLQKMFGHSTSAQTLDYIGITGDEIEEAYLSLNLGGTRSYVGTLVEEELA